jgi:WD40 repeat protein
VRRSVRLAGSLGVVAMVATLATVATPAQGAFYGANGRIVFQSVSGDGIYTVNLDGTGFTKVFDEPPTPGPPVRALPNWSPDGTRIAFASRVTGTSQIYTMAPDGSDVRQVTTTGENSAPAWGTNTEIAFVRTDPPTLRRIRSDGTNDQQIGPTGLQAAELAWDGLRLVYSRDNGGQYDIFSINTQFGTPAPVNLTASNPFTDDTSPELKPRFEDSPDQVLFRSFRDAGAGVESALWRMAPDGSGQAPLVTGHDAAFPAWAPDRTLLVFSDGAGMLHFATEDGADVVSLGIAGLTPDWQVSPSAPTGLRAFSGDERITLDWDDHHDPAVVYSVFRLWGCPGSYGGGDVIATSLEESSYVDAPLRNSSGQDCYRVRATDSAGNHSALSNLAGASALPGPYIRPKFASPVRVSLVPAFEGCESPNRLHGPPLAHPSCAPPAPSSSNLMIGVGDGAAAAARSIGSAKLKVRGTVGGADDSDVTVRVSITNVMNLSDLSEYSGELRTVLGLRITDRLNPSAAFPGSTGSGTVTDSQLAFNVPCAPTESELDKSTCAITTSADAIAPGAVPEAMRAIWDVDAVQVYDGGGDGDGDTTADNELFATQGVFVP